jgi:hypothetical protein
MTTENEVVTDTVAEPVIDTSAAEQAKREAEMQAELQAQDKMATDYMERVNSDMEALREEEAKIAAEQDAALTEVREACDAEREAVGLPTSDAPTKEDKLPT